VDAAGIVVFGSLVLTLLAAMVLPVTRQPDRRRVVATAVAAGFGLMAIGMVAFIVSEDDYFDDGGSIWAHHSSSRALLIGGVAAALGSTALAAWARRRPTMAALVPLAAIITVALNYVALASTTE
jgi:hypothetical protein